jgi:hypothetical protein
MGANDLKKEVSFGGFDPCRMSPDERLDELAELLAVGMLRLQQQSSKKGRTLPLNGAEIVGENGFHRLNSTMEEAAETGDRR